MHTLRTFVKERAHGSVGQGVGNGSEVRGQARHRYFLSEPDNSYSISPLSDPYC